jgi:hypothetical protein
MLTLGCSIFWIYLQILRIIQSIPSPKAEPFKMWLAQLGQECIDEVSM